MDTDVSVTGTMTIKGIDVGAALTRSYEKNAILDDLRNQLYLQAKANTNLWKSDESLVVYHRFETLSGGKAADSSPYGNHVSLSGGCKLVSTGKFCKGAAIPYGGTMSIANSKSLTFAYNSFTIAAWSTLKSRPYPRTSFTIKDGQGCYFGKGRAGANPGWEFGHGYRSSGVDFCMRDKDHNQARKGLNYDNGYKTGQLAEQWMHQVWIVDREARTVTTFINGKKMSEVYSFHKVNQLTDASDGSLGDMTNTHGITIGNTYGWRMDGTIDELRIYRRAVSNAEARALYTYEPPEHVC